MIQSQVSNLDIAAGLSLLPLQPLHGERRGRGGSCETKRHEENWRTAHLKALANNLHWLQNLI